MQRERVFKKEKKKTKTKTTLFWTTQKREDATLTIIIIIIIIITRLLKIENSILCYLQKRESHENTTLSLRTILLLYSVVVVVGIKKTFETHLERKRRPPKRLWFDDKEDRYLLLIK